MDYAVTVQCPIHWGEMDALGHVNNTCYFRWFESARIAYFARIGMTVGGAQDVGPILASAHCDFLRPLVYPAEIVIGARVSGVGHSSVAIDYGLWRVGDPTVLYARGTSVAVLIHFSTGEKVRVSDAIRQAVTLLEGDRRW